MPLRIIRDEAGNKQCTECKLFKHDSEYTLKRGRPKRKCVSCEKLLARKRVLNRIEFLKTIDTFPEFKTCNCCRQVKKLDDFTHNKSGKFRRAAKCKDCAYISNKKYRERTDSDPVLRAKKIEDRREWYRNSTHVWKNWCAQNRVSINAREARRRAGKLKATPKWANLEVIEKIYEEAYAMSSGSEIKYHVDHIVPLVSDIVCGLHCETNLQILPANENISKNNRFWPDMPD